MAIEWLRGRFVTLVEAFYDTVEIDTGDLIGKLGAMNDPEEMQRMLGDAEGDPAQLISATSDPDRLADLQAFTAFIEGYGDRLVRIAGADLLPTIDRIEQAYNTRRTEPDQAEQFLQQFAGWLGTPYAGAIELLEALQGRYLLACLSNINVVYWERQVTQTGLRASFDRCYASHEIGCLKPDPRSYAHVVSDLGVRPDAVVFFDDTERNVEAAVSMGMQAYRVQGPSEAKTVLRQLALL